MADPLTNAEREAWMAQWKAAASALLRVRAAELAATNLQEVATQLNQAFRLSLRVHPAGSWSGLIDQQRAFHRLGRDA